MAETDSRYTPTDSSVRRTTGIVGKFGNRIFRQRIGIHSFSIAPTFRIIPLALPRQNDFNTTRSTTRGSDSANTRPVRRQGRSRSQFNLVTGTDTVSRQMSDAASLR